MQTHARFGAEALADLRVDLTEQEHEDADFEGTPSLLPALAGELAFVSPEGQLQRTAELLGRGAVVVNVPPLPRTLRGRLAEHIEERVERELAARGAPSPYLAAWSAMPDDEDAEARLADQLFRARTVGATGIAFLLGSLAGSTTTSLDPHDSATLRVLAKATSHAPVVLLLDDGDVRLPAYAAPVALSSLMMGEDDASVTSIDAPALDPTPSFDPIEAAPSSSDVHLADDDDARPESAPACSPLQAAMRDALAEDEDEIPQVVHHVEATIEIEPHQEPDVAAHAEPPKSLSATIAIPTVGPSDAWRSWAVALGAARGPQPLAMLERLFTENYVPLANAIADGLDDARALRAYDEFRRGFERTYADAFATFGVTGRRPRLVMDAFDAATKQARAHDARTVNVLVVDSMRFDLGGLVRDALAARASGRASLTSESLLWSSLPTTTFRQLETLARGIDALRAPMVEETSDSLRGRSAENVRRLRVGSRELYKLDLVPSLLGTVQDPSGYRTLSQTVLGSLPGIAELTADALARHIETLAPRTLLFVIGDHGFCIDRRGGVSHGGASPEEVLVPALSYLIGDVH